MTFKNEYLSASRLKRFAQCPKSFDLHYVRGEPAAFNPATTFGSVLHSALERAYRVIVAEKITGRFPEDRLLAFFEEEWALASLSDFESFQDGVKILRDYVQAHALVEHEKILGIEQEFQFELEGFQVRGFIDRVDRLDAETVLITDYKSNRAIFTRVEVDQDLQLSIYAMAAQKLWPWAKTIRLSFCLLRHGIQMETSRNDEELGAARKYMVTLARASEQAAEFPARLNENCGWCDHRAQCPEYHRALLGKVENVCTDDQDLSAVAREREEVARLARILYARKEALEKILKRRLDEGGTLELGGVAYSLAKTVHLSYPPDTTLMLLHEFVGGEPEDLAAQLLVLDKGSVDDLVKKVAKQLTPAESRLLKVRLEAVAQKTYSPRFVAERVKTAEVAP
ncbi:MAG: PD-(D/E)XK nuclease family protein [Deltaproteobacteria bacterium]|nr:PD-(D/E)XK nuclease family protein [Deltaproteobacteria bacterium]